MKIKLLCFFSLIVLLGCSSKQETKTPNIVLIYADDLGYGDVTCYNKDSKIPTPNIDKLADNGMLFTDAHSPSGICSPSRYSILTGQYSWRTSRKSGNPKPGEQSWVNKGRVTIASMLRDNGYNTAAIGKWGLGSDWESAAKPSREGLDISADAIDYSKAIFSGKPYGFTYEEVHLWYGKRYGTKHYACHDVPGTAEKADGARWYFKNGMSQGGDPKFDDFDMEKAQMHYIARAVEYIDAAGKKKENAEFKLKKEEPFFLYYAPHIPHYPHVPAKQFQGKSGVGLYGDFITELDWAVGEIVKTLEKNNILDETMIIFTSDNGPESQVFGYIKEYDHHSTKDFRGIKRDLWQGGHTLPFIVSYPDKIKKGKTSNRLVSQTDILATLADYLNIELDNNNAEDSYSFIDELIDGEQANTIEREMAIHHSASGKLAIRKGDWVFINSKSGRDNAEPQWFKDSLGVVPHNEDFELFNLKIDPQQTKNLVKENPEKAEELKNILLKYVSEGRTVTR
ncbi:arylsulfatase [Labilibaculum sp.]|uniref:sulfatase family protein n=1 Tax=Labilibaculum sp. TaxID=2060723 RepID=UPI0035623E72